ncbi:MAG TPA: glycine betaine ABC transporter substrate-binding protein [Methylomirabilota bacterium]|jgi:osmoprotectant transport system permease protein|nr:glycine betaine ABC transporter substrate-binding protein [Methylomirabilota bacterium]
MTRRRLVVMIIAALVGTAPPVSGASPTIRVGSKSFTESYILAEIVAQVFEQTGEATVERKFGLGGTGVVAAALASGDLDVYPEYTGTISRAILKDPSAVTAPTIAERLGRLELAMSGGLGFENRYALAIRRETASRLGLQRLSDLGRHPELTAAFDPGFLEREDGWPGLRRHYGLALADVRIMEHALTYSALVSGRVDVIDVFSTDGQLARHDLVLLEDDKRFFPDYAAVLLVRRATPQRFPRTWAELERRLVGRIDGATMARLNAQADLDGKSFAEVAAEFLGRPGPAASGRRSGRGDLAKLTLEHLSLVLVSLLVAVAVGLPLGILAARRRLLGQVELVGVGLLQTIPALALLSFMIPLFGIGKVPALVALCLYALLPIVRNTYAGLTSLDPQLVDMARVMGLSGWQRLGWVELPLASVTIMAGIKTSAVLTVGTATLAAFIGGGGYGTLIVTGLALNDVGTILAGAVPAAVMALAMHAGFEGLDALVVPRVLRSRASKPLDGG